MGALAWSAACPPEPVVYRDGRSWRETVRGAVGLILGGVFVASVLFVVWGIGPVEVAPPTVSAAGTPVAVPAAAAVDPGPPFVAPTAVVAAHRTQEGDFRTILRRDGIFPKPGTEETDTDGHNVCGDLARNGFTLAQLAAQVEAERQQGHSIKLDPAHVRAFIDDAAAVYCPELAR